MGRKGELTKLLKGIKRLPKRQKPTVGKFANEIKIEIIEKIQEKGIQIARKLLNQKLKEEWIEKMN